MSSTGRLDVPSRAVGAASTGHLIMVPHQELPPLRAASMLPSRGSSRLQASPGAVKRQDLEFFYDTLGPGDSKSSMQSAGRPLSTHTAARAGRKKMAALDAGCYDLEE